VRIQQTLWEFHAAAQVGLLRFVLSRVQNRKQDPPGLTMMHYLGNDIHGACTEQAACKAKGIHWPASVNTFTGEPDIPGFDVRGTPRPNGRLILHKTDVPDRRVILVRGTPPDWDVVGHMLIGDGQNPRWWTDPGTGRPAYFVPPTELVPL
jgi:hypothetical protein